MTRKEIEEGSAKINWWHQIELPCEDGGVYITPGRVDHCTEELANNRFGIPENIYGKSVLDIGCNNGYHSFLAEKRGAVVTGLDPNQGNGDNINGFLFAKKAIGSGVVFYKSDLKDFKDWSFVNDTFDIVFYFGVLYHVKSPIEELQRVSELTKEYALIETAISSDIVFDGSALQSWQLLPGYDGDPTNMWYPSLSGLYVALIAVGFDSMEIIHVMEGGARATVKAIKKIPVS